MLQSIKYTSEDKSRAYKRLQADPQVEHYNWSITKVAEMWAYPQQIGFTVVATGETTVISETTPEMPASVKEFIERLKSERDKYIVKTYPELCS